MLEEKTVKVVLIASQIRGEDVIFLVKNGRELEAISVSRNGEIDKKSLAKSLGLNPNSITDIFPNRGRFVIATLSHEGALEAGKKKFHRITADETHKKIKKGEDRRLVRLATTRARKSRRSVRTKKPPGEPIKKPSYGAKCLAT